MRIFRVVAAALLVALLTACGSSEPAGEGPTSGAGEPTAPAPATGAPFEFAENDGFRYSLTVSDIGTVPETEGATPTAAPPGKAFPYFKATLTNLQSDRSAPWPGWTSTLGSGLKFGVPETKAPGAGSGRWDCSSAGLEGEDCIGNLFSNLSCRQATTADGPAQEIRSFGTPPLPSGATVHLTCVHKEALPELRPDEIHLYFDAKAGEAGRDLRRVPGPSR